MPERRITLDNATVLDVIKGQRLPQQRVVLKGGKIEQVEPVQAEPSTALGEVIDVKGMTVMPGLCDAHVHVTDWTPNIAEQMRSSPYYTAARAAEILAEMLQRGFTTVRDGGGADYGLALAVEEGYLQGPRILFCGQALSPTGGHGDMRGPGERVVEGYSQIAGLGRLCDGVTEVRKACR